MGQPQREQLPSHIDLQPPLGLLPLESCVAPPLSEGETGVRIDWSVDQVPRGDPEETNTYEEGREERIGNDPRMDFDVVEGT